MGPSKLNRLWVAVAAWLLASCSFSTPTATPPAFSVAVDNYELPLVRVTVNGVPAAEVRCGEHLVLTPGESSLPDLPWAVEVSDGRAQLAGEDFAGTEGPMVVIAREAGVSIVRDVPGSRGPAPPPCPTADD